MKIRIRGQYRYLQAISHLVGGASASADGTPNTKSDILRIADAGFLGKFEEVKIFRKTNFAKAPNHCRIYWAIVTLLGLSSIGCEPSPKPPKPAEPIFEEKHFVCGNAFESSLDRLKPMRFSEWKFMDSIEHLPRHPWEKTVILHDRLANGDTSITAIVTIKALSMKSWLSPTEPILTMDETRPTHVWFPDNETHRIKFQIIRIDWRNCKNCDGTDKYRIVQRNVWADMDPQPWAGNKENPKTARKKYVNSLNIEMTQEDTLFGYSIFKIDSNRAYTFLMGLKALGPNSTNADPEIFPFKFVIHGIGYHWPQENKPTRKDSLRKVMLDSLDRLPHHPWATTIFLQDHYANGDTPIVASVTVQAFANWGPFEMELPVMTANEAMPTRIVWKNRGSAGIKFKIVKVDWSPCTDYDSSWNYRIIQEHEWYDANPFSGKLEITDPRQLRKNYDDATNPNGSNGKRLPIPILVPIKHNGIFIPSLPYKAITPKTAGDHFSRSNFQFSIEGIAEDE
jgi:hypothetical protein